MARKSLLKELLGARVIALALFDESHIEEARSVVRIEFESVVEVFQGFIEASEMAVGESHEGVGSGRGIEFDELA